MAAMHDYLAKAHENLAGAESAASGAQCAELGARCPGPRPRRGRICMGLKPWNDTMQHAIAEVEARILAVYPDATFRLVEGEHP